MCMRSRQHRKTRIYVEIRCVGRQRFLWAAHLTQILNLPKQIFVLTVFLLIHIFLCHLGTEMDQTVQQMATFRTTDELE
jgi:hypothetical protein